MDENQGTREIPTKSDSSQSPEPRVSIQKLTCNVGRGPNITVCSSTHAQAVTVMNDLIRKESPQKTQSPKNEARNLMGAQDAVLCIQ